jgi:hypothetical protein
MGFCRQWRFKDQLASDGDKEDAVGLAFLTAIQIGDDFAGYGHDGDTSKCAALMLEFSRRDMITHNTHTVKAVNASKATNPHL